MKRLTSKMYMGKWLSFWLGLSLISISWAQSVTLLPESFVSYQAKDERETVLGQAAVKTLELSLDPENLKRSRLTISLDASSFDSRNPIRDTNARLTVFESGKFPEIVFVLNRIPEDLAPLQTGESLNLTLEGDLAMHGQSKTLTVPVLLSRDDQKFKAVGDFEILLSDFEMSRPSFLFWTIEDQVLIHFEIQFAF